MNTRQEAGTTSNQILGDMLILVPTILLHNQQRTINRISHNRHLISIIGTQKPIQLDDA